MVRIDIREKVKKWFTCIFDDCKKQNTESNYENNVPDAIKR